MNTKKAVSLVLAVSVMSLAAASCEETKVYADDEIIDLAAQGADYVRAREVAHLASISSGFFQDDKTGWEEKLDFSTHSALYDDDTRAVFAAVCQGMGYDVDVSSVTVDDKAGKGSILVEFSPLDYDAVFDNGPCNDAQSIIESLSSCPRKDVEIVFTFEIEDGEWKLSNPDEILEEIYGYVDMDLELMPDLTVSDYWFEWDCAFSESSHLAVNTPFLSCYYMPYEVDDISGMYYVLTKDGEEYYSDLCDDGNVFISALGPGEPYAPDDLNMPAGEYSIAFYDGADRLLYEDSITVIEADDTMQINTIWYEEDACWGGYALYDDASSFAVQPMNSWGDPSRDQYFTITYDGEIIYTGYAGWNAGSMYASDVSPDNWIWDPGVYTVEYHYNDTDAVFLTAVVIVTENGVGPDGTFLGAFEGLNVTNLGLSINMYEDMANAFWYSDDIGTAAENGILTDAASLTYRIPVQEDYGTIEYVITYSEDGSAEVPYNTGFTASAEMQTDADGNMYYEFSYDGTVEPGYYGITVGGELHPEFYAFSICHVQ